MTNLKTDQSILDFIYEPVHRQLETVEDKLKSLSNQEHSALEGLLAHTALIPGKRVRPAITLLAGRTQTGSEELLTTMGAAVELLHVASLIHDDMVDHASLRRGRATVNSLWGNNIAVMFGDFMFAVSAVHVCDTGNVRVVRRFAETIMELSTGQILESFGAFNANCSLDQYKDRIYNKTATLFRTAAESGAILSGAPEPTVQLFVEYGRNLGMAFQIIDDILDFEGTEEEVGKPVGLDLIEGKVTLPALLLMERYPQDSSIDALFRGNSPEANHKRVLEMLRNSSILSDSYAVAGEFCDQAKRTLLQLPDTRERRSLMELASYVLERRR